ncbi:MAG: S1 RNA-binding domain-containing protein, partial [Chloroflexota bacterium]|nr:S1 RNA-binding domain-containing protein [Chloroflexota bacterium]
TLKEPLAFEWNDLKSGETYVGNVTRLERFGAFVDIGAERPGLVHIREITMGRLEHPEEILTIGEEVEVQLLGINKKKRQINLSMRTLEQKFMDSEDDEDPVPTAMELALRAAMVSESEAKQDKPLKHKKESRSTQEDILRRTLEGRPND